MLSNPKINYMDEEEASFVTIPRNDPEARNIIGWKFENAWPLAWYFGYKTPEITGQMMTGEDIQKIISDYTCGLDENMDDWLKEQKTRSEEEVIKMEDLFYCLHNAVRSARMGGNTVPKNFDPVGNGGVIHERRHSLTWMLSPGVKWEDTDVST